MLDRNASAGRSPRLNCADFLLVPGAFAHLVDDFFERCAEGEFDEAGVLYFADEREDFCARAFLCAKFCKFGPADRDDERNIEPRFNIVDVRGTFPKAFLRRIGRTGNRTSCFSFD